jgi:RimJ/RimL family protein N-acetyltransferase
MPVLRDARVADATQLCAAERATAAAAGGRLIAEPQELLVGSFQKRIAFMADGRGKYLVAEAGGRMVGHASLMPLPRKNIAHVVTLDICVHPGQTRRGYGKAMLTALVDWARQRAEVRKIELWVRASNHPAIMLYQACGFVEEGRLREHVRVADGVFVDDVCFGLSVA